MYVNLLELESLNDIMEYSFAQKSTFMTIFTLLFMQWIISTLQTN